MSDRMLANAKQLRSHMTEAEQLLWRELRAHRFQGWKFRRQQPLGPYIVDFVCMQARVVIEADGGQHNGCERDRIRDAWLQQHGFNVLRYWNHDVVLQPDCVLDDIYRALSESPLSPTPLPRGERG